MSTENELISVICTVYNTKQYLTKSLDSIFNQSYRNIEIILIDDGSTDGSDVILEDYSHLSYNVRLIHQSNKGHSEARNVGLSLANGDYIFFVDSDDIIHPRTLELLHNNLKETDADISIGQVYIGSSEPNFEFNSLELTSKNYSVFTNIEALHILVDSVNDNYRNSLFVPMCATWNKLFKRYLFNDVKFPAGRVHDDNATAHKLLYNANRVVVSSFKTYFYRQHTGSIVSRGIFDRDMIWAMEDRINFFEEKELTDLLDATYLRYAQVLKYAYKKTKSPEVFDKICNLNAFKQFSLLAGIKRCKTLGLYYRALRHFDGISTWLYNFANSFNDEYYIVVYAAKVEDKIKEKLSKVATVVEVKGDQTYQCDILLDSQIFEAVPGCIKYSKIIKVIHADYVSEGFFDGKQFDSSFKYVAVSDVVASRMKNKFGINCDSAEGLLVKIRPIRKKVLHLISATRFTSDKGFDRFVKLALMLRAKNILFEWRIYCDSDYNEGSVLCPEMIRLPAVDNETLMSYIADADYLVQLSRCEGFGIAVHEALMMDTPVIVSDIAVFTKYVEDGRNGYIVPNNMDEFDVTKLLRIPKSFIHLSTFDAAREKWKMLIEEV